MRFAGRGFIVDDMSGRAHSSWAAYGRLVALLVALGAAGVASEARAADRVLRYQFKAGQSRFYRLTSDQEIRFGNQVTKARLKLDVRVRVRQVKGDEAELLLTVERASGTASISGRMTPNLTRLLEGLARAQLRWTQTPQGEIRKSYGWEGASPSLAPLLENLRQSLELTWPRLPREAVGPSHPWVRQLSATRSMRRGLNADVTASVRYRFESELGGNAVIGMGLTPSINALSQRRKLQVHGAGRGKGSARLDCDSGTLSEARMELEYDLEISRPGDALHKHVRLGLTLQGRQPETAATR